MAAKNKRRPGTSVHDELVAHMGFARRAEAWAEKAVKLREAGQNRKADDAQLRVIFWLKKAIAIERRIERGMPTGGRA